MKPHCKSSALFVSGIVLCIATLRAFPATVSGGSALTPLSDLEQQAHQRMNTKPRVPLAEATSPIFNGVETGERPGTGLVPNYLRAMALLPKMPAPLAHLFRTIVSGTALPSETKLAMALRIAQVNRSAYTAVHIERLLRTTGRGRLILSDLASNRTDSLSTPERRALEFAEASSKHVDGLGDGEFQGVRAVYNDAQIVELHFVSCFFNYFTRLVEAWRLPVEPWAFESLPTALPEAAAEPARVSLVSDAEMSAVAATDASVRTAGSGGAGLGIALVNSQRAMLRAPAMYEAWRSFGAAASGYDAVSREIKLQVSFAVSTANGCRYCTLHQVLGLRRLGVSPAKLMAMQKDDRALTPEELSAVVFARKLTAEPAGITDADYDALRRVFHEEGAVEVLMQTCNFAFMNRFTDGLRLPSEDEAVRVYRETYGSDWQPRKNRSY